jgi:hypothetical protein
MFGVCSDNVDDSELHHLDSDHEGVEEVENEDEELWRRMRHEREMFLQQQVCTNRQTGSKEHISICMHPVYSKALLIQMTPKLLTIS